MKTTNIIQFTSISDLLTDKEMPAISAITNAIGQVIDDSFLIDVNSNWVKLDIKGPPGVYFVTLRSKDDKKISTTTKVVKQ